jgi:hypothetical protein
LTDFAGLETSRNILKEREKNQESEQQDTDGGAESL